MLGKFINKIKLMKTIILIISTFLIINLVYSQDSDFIYKEEQTYTKEVKLLWTGKSGNEFGYKAHIDGGLLYVVNAIEREDTGNGQIFAYDKSTGKLIWQTEKHYGEPIKDLVIDGNEIIYTTRRSIVSVNKTNGKTNWSFDSPYSMMLSSRPGVFENTIVATTADTDIFAISRKTQEIIWEKEITEIATPDLYKYKNNIIFVDDSEDAIYSINVQTGKINWTYKGETSSQMTLEGNKIYLGNGGRGVMCVNLDTGKQKWESKIDDNPYINGRKFYCASAFSSEPLIVGDIIYAGDYTHTVAALDKNTGKVLWKDYYPMSNRSEICLYKDKLLLSSEEEGITLLDKDGKVIEKYKLPKYMTTEDSANYISVDKQTKKVYMTNDNGKIFCVEL